MSAKSRLWLLAAMFILAICLLPVFAGAQGDTTVTATSDKQFVKPGADFTVAFSLSNVSKMYNYEIDLPLGALVTAADTPPWVEGTLFSGHTTTGQQNTVDATNFPEPTAVLARTLQGDDFLSFTDAQTIGSIRLKAGTREGIFTVPLQNITNQNADTAIVRFDDSDLNKILYSANPTSIVIDGTAPVVTFGAGNPTDVTDVDSVTITGTISDANLDVNTVTVNSAPVTVTSLGGGNYSFSTNVALTAVGDNTITVSATDKAGNTGNGTCHVNRQVTCAAAPTANPVPGTFAGGVMVALSSATPGAEIHYTVDGNDPTENSTLYTDRITVTSSTTIKAIAVKSGLPNSAVVTFNYVITGAGAGDDSLVKLAAELVKVHAQMDDNDRSALTNFRANLAGQTQDQWSSLLSPVLNSMTSNARSALGSDQVDQVATLKTVVLDLADILYSSETDQATVENQLKIFRSTWKNLFTGLFDNGITVDELYNFIMDVQSALPHQFTTDDLRQIISDGVGALNDVLPKWIKGAAHEVVDQPGYANFKDRLSSVGLSIDLLLQAKDNVVSAVDSNNSAEGALAKAYIRSKTTLSDDKNLTDNKNLIVRDTVNYLLSATIGDTTIKLDDLLVWSSSNPDVAGFNYGASTLIANAPGTTTVTAYKGQQTDWLAKFVVNVAAKTDDIPPTIITATHNAGTGWLNAGKSFKITVLSEPGDTAYYKVGDGAWVSMPEHQFIKGRYQGTYTVTAQSPNGSSIAVQVKVVDPSHNETTQGLTAVKIDTAAPNAPAIALSNIDQTAKTATANISGISDATSGAASVDMYVYTNHDGWILLQNFGESQITGGIASASVNLREGSNRFGAKVYDRAGNYSGISDVTHILDTQPPVFSIDVEHGVGGLVNVTVTSSKALSGSPNAVYKVVYDDGTVAEQGAIALTSPVALEYQGSFTTSHNGELDITVTGTGRNGRQATGIYTELALVGAIGQDIDMQDIGLLVPKDAYFENLTRIEGSPDKGDAGADRGLDVGEAKLFRPDGTVFRDVYDNPVYVAITFNYSIVDFPDPNKIIIYYYNPTTGSFEQWTDKTTDGIPANPVPKKLYINTVKHTITIYTDHFSVYGVAADNIPPVLNITSPADGSTAGDSVNVAGSSEAGAAITISVNGIQAASLTVDGTGNFSRTVATQTGQNTITVTATDASMNSTSRTVTVTNEPKPALTMNNPTADTSTTDSSITISFSTDANDVGVTVAANGGAAQSVAVTPGANGVFTANVPLAVGTNLITVTATNDVGTTTRTVTVTRTTGGGGGGGGGYTPALTMNNPTADISTTDSSITISFNTNADPSKVGVTVAANGGAAQSVAVTPGANGVFTANVPLAVGTNLITVTATNDVGTTTRTVTVTRTTGGGGGGGGGAPANEVGSGGGTVKNSDGSAKVEVPADALSQKINITINKVDASTVSPPSGALKLAGDVYEFGPTGTQFAKPVKITLKYDPAKLAGASEDKLKINVFDETTKTWVELGGVVDMVNKTVTVEVTHFSKYAVMAPVEVPPAAFADIEEHWARAEIEKLVGMGVLTGYPDKTFKPESNITRAEFTTMLVRALKLDLVKPAQPTFTDVPAGEWSYGYVEAAFKAGLVKGFEGQFLPGDMITRQEIAVILVRAMGLSDMAQEKAAAKLYFADAGDIASWANGFVAVALDKGLIKGYPDGAFGPQNNATRAEAATMAVRFLEARQK